MPASGLLPPPGLELPGASSLRGVLPDVVRSFGVDPALVADLPSAGLDLPRTERAVVLLVDGLGWQQLQARAGHAPTLRRVLQETPEGAGFISAGYPSTTAASLASFGTGLSSGTTGLLGYTVRDPRTERPELLNLVQWSREDGEPGPPAATWQPYPTVFQRVDGLVRSTSVGRARFAGSGLSVAALRGPRFIGAESLGSAVGATVDALRQPGLVYLYWGALDAVGHQRGWASAEWGEALAELDAGLTMLLRRLPRGTSLVLTADHGMVDITTRYDVGTDEVLARDVELVAGEPRALHLHLAPGASPSQVAARWRERLGEDAWVLTGADAVAGGLFGEVAEHNRVLVGDVVVALRGTAAVHDSRTQSASSLTLAGMHGSLTSAELEIPALVWRP